MGLLLGASPWNPADQGKDWESANLFANWNLRLLDSMNLEQKDL